MATESWVVSGPQIIDIESVSSVQATLVGGRVDVVAHEDPSVRGARIEVHAVQGRPLEVSWADGRLRLGYGFMDGSWEAFVDQARRFTAHDRAEIHLAVPRTAGVRLGTVTGDGLLSGVEADSTVSTVSGAFVTDRTVGCVTVSTVSGEVAVRRHDGDLKLRSVSSDLVASGRLRRVSATSVSGTVALDTTERGPSTVTAQTASGDVTVRLPAEVGVAVDARSVSGRVVVDGAERGGGSPGRTEVDLPVPGATCRITSATVSGHLTVLRGVEGV